jgi:hypothetical protein
MKTVREGRLSWKRPLKEILGNLCLAQSVTGNQCKAIGH